MALRETGDKRAEEPLIEALPKAKHWSVRRTAANSPEKIGDREAVEPLIKALRTSIDSSGTQL